MTKFHKRLGPGKFRKNKKRIFGFDIETDKDNKNIFICASIYGDDGYQKFFRNKRDVIKEFQTKRFRNSIIAATNAGFDFFGTFDGEPEIMNFKLLMRGSFLLYARTWIDSSSKFFYKTKDSPQAYGTVTFLDTLNYAMMSVEQMGDVLGMPKLKIGDKIGKVPRNAVEWCEMKDYNMRDARISQMFMKFLYGAFEELGASPRITIASTAMSLFRNMYLKDTYYTQKTEDILEIMKAYYGGRTETFRRGPIGKRYYYDINSAYPYSMTKALPNPNKHRVTYDKSLDYINQYEGCSEVSIMCPDEMKIPYLPCRYEGLLLFPTGTFKGWYTHFELRKALSMGYIIKEVYKTHYYTEVCYPLKEYAKENYKRRLTRKKTPMGMVDKLFLNSLYGKFGQRFMDRDDIQPISAYSADELNSFESFERIGDFIRTKKDGEPSYFCIPIWAAYITAYTRTLWFDFAVQCDPDYGDTDSLITKRQMPESNELGEFKLEMKVNNGIIIRNKMYALIDEENKEYVKIKGVMKRVKVKPGGSIQNLNYQIFTELEASNFLYYDKFMKFKESQRRGFKVNEVIEVAKELNLDDQKRSWPGPFSFKELQSSMPLKLIDGVPSDAHKALMIKARDEEVKRIEKEIQLYIGSDLFDKGSAGFDDRSGRLLFDSEKDAWKE